MTMIKWKKNTVAEIELWRPSNDHSEFLGQVYKSMESGAVMWLVLTETGNR